ncbi:MAG: histidine phosphatase family protein [Patescibacteria group bacterium]
MERHIYLTRHGETDFNLTKRVQDAETPVLTKRGQEHALALKATIETMGVDFDCIICADTKRTRQTLALIFPDYKNMPQVLIDPRNQERLHRGLIGYTKQQIAEAIGVELQGRLSWPLYFEGTDQSVLTNRFPENETIEQIRERVSSLIDEFQNHTNILIIGSSIINHYILEYLIHGSIGKQKAEYPEGNQLDFQSHDEIRVVTLDENMHVTNYKIIQTGQPTTNEE